LIITVERGHFQLDNMIGRVALDAAAAASGHVERMAKKSMSVCLRTHGSCLRHVPGKGAQDPIRAVSHLPIFFPHRTLLKPSPSYLQAGFEPSPKTTKSTPTSSRLQASLKTVPDRLGCPPLIQVFLPIRFGVWTSARSKH
jgi:hypothetical protein